MICRKNIMGRYPLAGRMMTEYNDEIRDSKTIVSSFVVALAPPADIVSVLGRLTVSSVVKDRIQQSCHYRQLKLISFVSYKLQIELK